MSLLEKLTGKGKVGEGDAPRGEASSPADKPARAVTGRTRIPLSLPRQKLEVPALPGYVLQWFADRPGRIRQAEEAGYQFVSPEEIALNSTGVADDPLRDGNTDMGSGVSTYAGVSEQGTAERLYLMKIQEAFWLEDQKVIADRNESVAEAIRGGQVATNPHEAAGDRALQYGGMANRAPRKRAPQNLFTRKRG